MTFEELTISDIGFFKYGKSLPEEQRVNGNVPVYGSSGITGFHDKPLIKKPSIIIGRKGSVGTLYYSKKPFFPIDTVYYVDEVKKDFSLKYYYYFLSQIGLKNMNSDAAVPGLNRNWVHSLKTNYFSPEIQKKIAAVLTAYDELIDNNQQRLTLLEKIAEEIYREWFVRLRFPGHEKAKVNKGVPEGWQVKTLGNIVEYYIGGGWGEDDQSTSFSEEGYVIRGTDIPHIQNGNFTVCPFRFHKPSNLKSRKLQPNDFVFEVSGGSTNQLLGRNVHITESFLNFFDAPVIAASFCKLIRFHQDQVSSYFMKYFMKLYYDCDLVGIYQIQSTGISNYQFESFLKYQTITLPPKELQKKFDDLVMPILDMRDKISLANIQLKKSRDLLLPRLISGKLSVASLDIKFPPSMEDDLQS